MLKQIAVAACIAVSASTLALAAQSTGSSEPSQAAAPPYSPSINQPQSDKSSQLGKQDKTLAETLSQSNGTIQPPAVDPGMAKAPPATEPTMPVVRPPANEKSK